MKHISLLIPAGDTSLSNLEATYKMFTRSNDAVVRAGKPPLFQVQLVGLTREARLSNGVFSVQPDVSFDEIDRTDLIIIPAVHGDMQQVIAANSAFAPWIVRQYRQGAEVVSLCIGAFILASTGLLDGRSCTTHWLSADEFRRMFPNVELTAYKIITDEGGIYTSGGAYSALNLIVYLVEKFAGRDMALLTSKVFEIDIDRNSQSPFIIFKGQKDHEDEPIKRAQEFIEQNFQERITVDQLASTFAIGRRNLERRFKKATANTVAEYIQRVKIEAAKISLESSRENVNEVMYKVGYTDPKAFRVIFKRITGLSPLQYRNKYNREISV
ncbi:GlxA family transcriptional regulator [Siphonobacter aquaeclarae]|uniref:Transcriptional regulator GlxA family, contains an amidase domain and an AraC-type DNA-binding HTH domain n=1 Tax=Siphonobacter aquaeclarae TaxID=563176 RepID=A0A1G9HWP8_9BACT|nr:helix-turn-helix domain-containing protein [Siphonobacter aquaeclarae]SDL17390.1 Transcriptional regulator GlxA family, contains an amidase domain and an AraC-type DNA-binding HTH domain [Siphonobacter aquaeclarae]